MRCYCHHLHTTSKFCENSPAEDNFNNTFQKKYYPCGLRYNPTDNVSKGSKYYGFKRKAEGFYWVFLYFITFVCVNKHNLYGFTFTNTCLS